MNLKVTPYSAYNQYKTYNNISKTNNNVSFNGATQKVLRYTGYTLAALAMFTAMSCSNKNKSNDVLDIDNDITITENTDSMPSAEIEEKHPDKNKARRVYHYLPKDDIVTGDQYDWSELIYPDGKVEKDSLGYKVSVSAQGERTVVKTEEDEYGNVITTTTLPDESKIIKCNYKSSNPFETLIVEKTFRKDGTLKENRYFNEYPSDSINTDSLKTTERSLEVYNEKEVLLYWESSCTDPERSKENNIYDKLGRLRYDDINNENFYYMGQSKTPYKSVALYEDCQRITLYNRDGSTEKIYFKASDGTITEYLPEI